MIPLVISIVICTHNRADLARDAILSVLEQDFPRDEYELLIVDNASTDNTRAMAQEICKTHSNVRYIFESNVGLSHARNRGWTEASGEYVGYLDDDAKASAQWLSAAYTVVKDIHPEAFGGPYYAFYNTPKPRWFKDEYGSSVQGAVARPLRDGEYVSGGNMFICRNVLAQLAGFHSNLGMKGKKKGYGEETNFFIRLRSTRKNAVIYYDPNVFIYHLVRSEKFRLYHMVSSSFVGGRQYYLTLGDNNSPRVLSVVLIVLTMVFDTIKSLTWDILRRDRKAYPFYQNYIYERITIIIFWLGYQIENLKTCRELF